MSDCQNLDVRDLLPELARGELDGAQLVAVEEHLALCASCRAEVALLRDARAMLHGGPSIDTARIANAIVRSAGLRRDATTAVQARRRRAWGMSAPSRRVWLAAASVGAIATVALLATGDVRRPEAPDAPPAVAQTSEPTAPAATPPARIEPTRPARAEIVMGGGVSDLADADLESLLNELDGLDAQLDVEPAAILPLREGDV